MPHKNSDNELNMPFFLNKYCCEELLARLEFLTLQPKDILILGEDDYYAKKLLQIKYPNAKIFSDKHFSWTDHSVDLVFANLILITDSFKDHLKEWCRVLRSQGVVLFSALGPDTLKEISPDNGIQILPLVVDMHDLGDEILHARLADPVLDVENLTVTYRDISQLKQEMQIGQLIHSPGDVRLEKNKEGFFELTFECVFGHAFGPSTDDFSADAEGVVRIPLAHLRGRGGKREGG